MTKDEAWLLAEKYGGDESAPGFAADRDRLAEGEPVAYLIGHQPFLGITINLDSRPLIPRPETEWWANELVTSLSLRESGTSALGLRHGQAARSGPASGIPAERLSFLDLCAGSGAIGCAALARLPAARVYFGEIDPSHEATIRKNIRENRLDATRADIRIGDLFQPLRDLTFDIIAANPPYIPEGRALPGSVADFEPAQALFAGPDGLSVMRQIARELPKRLNPGGIAWIECDSAHAEEARRLFEHEGFEAEVRADQYGTPRVLVCRGAGARSAR